MNARRNIKVQNTIKGLKDTMAEYQSKTQKKNIQIYTE